MAINAHKFMPIKLSSVNLAGPRLYKYSESNKSLPNKGSPIRSINDLINLSPDKSFNKRQQNLKKQIPVTD